MSKKIHQMFSPSPPISPYPSPSPNSLLSSPPNTPNTGSVQTTGSGVPRITEGSSPGENVTIKTFNKWSFNRVSQNFTFSFFLTGLFKKGYHKHENDTDKISCDFDVVYYPARAKNLGGLYHIYLFRNFVGR